MAGRSFFEDLENVGKLVKDLVSGEDEPEPPSRHTPPAPVVSAPPILEFDCSCGACIAYDLSKASPESVCSAVRSHLAACAVARGHIG